MASSNATHNVANFIKRDLQRLTFRWTVNNFSKLGVDRIVTDSFSASNSFIKWNLQIFPRGRETKFRDYVAVFVHHRAPTGLQRIECAYTLGILDQDNNVCLTRRCQGLFEEGRGWG